MTGVRVEFTQVGRVALGLLRSPEVAGAWERESALAGMSVGALAAHLAFQVLGVDEALAAAPPSEPVVGLSGHYERSGWIGSDFDAPINVTIRAGSARLAQAGPAGVADSVAAALCRLEGALGSAGQRAARLPFWGEWALSLDDLLVTRMMELVVHADDVAVSVGVATPEFSAAAVERVMGLLTRLAVRRHGAVAVVRALSRAERAPASITAF